LITCAQVNYDRLSIVVTATTTTTTSILFLEKKV
jgi:hypothetical protein